MTLRDRINSPNLSPSERLAALQDYCASGALVRGVAKGEVNNHVHTFYSFSPYSPAMAALRAYETGLDAVGSVDHDSIGAAPETLEAGIILGIATTVGFELRVSFKDTEFAHSRINYPDSLGNAYMVAHGLPEESFAAAEDFLAPLRAIRVERTRRMTDAAAHILTAAGCAPLDFDQHVAPLTKLTTGGSVTERHLLAAAADLIIAKTGKGSPLISFLRDKLKITVSGKLSGYLSDPGNPHYRYDLLGLLKTSLIDQVFIEPDDRECLPVRQVVDFIRSINAIPAYAYLGDVGQSVTGDKKTESFEDAYLDSLMSELKSIGFQAISYMPPRNTLEQLRRVQNLCTRHGFMEISGVDINSSRQDFNCPEILRPEFLHLNDATWALIAHEKLATQRPQAAFFHPQNPQAGLDLTQRSRCYALAGRSMDPRHPQSIRLPDCGSLPDGAGLTPRS